MTPGPRRSRWRHLVGALFLAMLVTAAIWRSLPFWNDPEIVLKIGGTYEEMQANSTAPFSPLIRGHIWGGIPKADARLRFIDPQYGFETPLARFFTVTFDDNVIEDVVMSPQVEPLLIDDALAVSLNLQDQLRDKGWVAKGLRANPTIADTPEWRSYLRQGILHGQSNWQAGDKYQVTLSLGRFKDYRNPTQERYLITLALSKPWLPFDEIEDMYDEPSHFPAPQPK